MYDTTSGKSSLWVNHGKLRDFACRLPLRASTLNLFNRVVHFDESSGFNGYIESVEMYNYFKFHFCSNDLKTQREPMVPFRSR